MATKAEHITALKASHPTVTRLVNGVRETLSDSEYKAKIDQWATANAATDVRNDLKANGGESADYASFRTDSMVAGSYPSIPDQLDMQYHDAVDNTTTWADTIAAVKSKYPKPG